MKSEESWRCRHPRIAISLFLKSSHISVSSMKFKDTSLHPKICNQMESLKGWIWVYWKKLIVWDWLQTYPETYGLKLCRIQHIINRIMCSGIDEKIPKEKWRDKAVYLGYFRICLVYAHHSGDDKSKTKAYKGIFMEFMDRFKGHRIWNHVDKKIVHSIHVTLMSL